MFNLPVSDETAKQTVELQELLGAGSDTVVALGLAALMLAVEEHTAATFSAGVVATRDDLQAAIALVNRHGLAWAQLAGHGERASTVLGRKERDE